jgi:hypothetical protein
MKRNQASDEGWRRLAEEDPPLPLPEPAVELPIEPEGRMGQKTDALAAMFPEGLGPAIRDVASYEVGEWMKRHSLTLDDACRDELVEEVVGDVALQFWLAGLDRKLPHLTMEPASA